MAGQRRRFGQAKGTQPRQAVEYSLFAFRKAVVAICAGRTGAAGLKAGIKGAGPLTAGESVS